MGFLFETMNCFKMNCDQALYNSVNYAKNHGVLHFKWVNYMVYELYLNMLLFKIKYTHVLKKGKGSIRSIWVGLSLFRSSDLCVCPLTNTTQSWLLQVKKNQKNPKNLQLIKLIFLLYSFFIQNCFSYYSSSAIFI